LGPASDKLIDNISFTKAQTNDEWLVKKIIKDLKEIDYQLKKLPETK
jgi:hypothetical protein